jgi:hypothetical protein
MLWLSCSCSSVIRTAVCFKCLSLCDQTQLQYGMQNRPSCRCKVVIAMNMHCCVGVKQALFKGFRFVSLRVGYAALLAPEPRRRCPAIEGCERTFICLADCTRCTKCAPQNNYVVGASNGMQRGWALLWDSHPRSSMHHCGLPNQPGCMGPDLCTMTWRLPAKKW